MKSEMKFNFQHLFEFVKLEIITMITFTEEILTGKLPFLSSETFFLMILTNQFVSLFLQVLIGPHLYSSYARHKRDVTCLGKLCQ